jgi:4-hydroxy-tetrahydrodipicolinate reductase
MEKYHAQRRSYMKIAILGAAGRMGRKLCELAKGTDLEVVAKVDVADGYDREWPAGTEGVIDFSYHAALPGAIDKAAQQGIAYVIGTTGITPEEQVHVDAAAKRIPVVQSGNYSLGVNLLLELVRKAATVLGPEYDIEITEMHHRHKKDAPSGTALMLARSANEGRAETGAAVDGFTYGRKGDTGERPVGEIAIHALRGGSVVGDHTVMFAGELERVEISHKAQDRAAFAAGALKAMAWTKGRQPGIYTMRDVLGFA